MGVEAHEYNPDPKTGQCLSCPPRAPVKRGNCRWCSHISQAHTGSVDEAVLKHYEIEVRGPRGPEKAQSVRWTPRACAAYHCACRRYEQ